MTGTYIAHHGIKGQKWGVRNYQNPDGSYTAAGKARYGLLDASNNVKNERVTNPISKNAKSGPKSSVQPKNSRSIMSSKGSPKTEKTSSDYGRAAIKEALLGVGGHALAVALAKGGYNKAALSANTLANAFDVVSTIHGFKYLSRKSKENEELRKKIMGLPDDE